MIPCRSSHLWSRAGLRHLLIEPELEMTDDRWHGCTPLALRILWLLSYRRCVTVDRAAGQVRIDTRRFWFVASTRIIRVDSVARVVCSAQAMPTGLQPWRLFTSRSMVDADVAFYYVALVLRDGREEIPLFTLIESLPAEDGVLTRLSGDSDGNRIGDEGATRLVTQLQDYLGLARVRR